MSLGLVTRKETTADRHTHTRLTALFSGFTWVSQYQKGKTSPDFTEASDNWVAVASACLHLARGR